MWAFLTPCGKDQNEFDYWQFHFDTGCILGISYNKATNVITKSTHIHARVACYTFSERSWHADPQSMEKWVTPLKAVP